MNICAYSSEWYFKRIFRNLCEDISLWKTKRIYSYYECPSSISRSSKIDHDSMSSSDDHQCTDYLVKSDLHLRIEHVPNWWTGEIAMSQYSCGDVDAW